MRKRRYNKVDSWTRMHPDANAEAPDIEELVRLGSAGGPCPFYLSRDMASTADIVFMPYNYLVDAKIRGGLKMVHWPNAVLVFDEAHNVEVIGSCISAPHTFFPTNMRASYLHKHYMHFMVFLTNGSMSVCLQCCIYSLRLDVCDAGGVLRCSVV